MTPLGKLDKSDISAGGKQFKINHSDIKKEATVKSGEVGLTSSINNLNRNPLNRETTKQLLFDNGSNNMQAFAQPSQE
jgi:hypothetical protein